MPVQPGILHLSVMVHCGWAQRAFYTGSQAMNRPEPRSLVKYNGKRYPTSRK